jgi:23S rRNA (cytosine1962-C5)-methyltransferase
MTAVPGTYALLDAGGGRKLEQVGPYRIVRPAPQAVWAPALDAGAWQSADAEYVRSDTGGGAWRGALPEGWEIALAGFTFLVKGTGFGHLGVFPEQAECWGWITEATATAAGRLGRAPKLLNLFAYTGGSTLAALSGGAEVTHVDASRGVVAWARDNAARSGLSDRPCRWLVEDAQKFLGREARRGARYDGMILDPPSFGRGSKGEVWKIEPGAVPLLMACAALLAPEAALLLFTCHTPGFTPTVLANLVAPLVKGRGGIPEAGEMTIPERSAGRPLPSGTYLRWRAP